MKTKSTIATLCIAAVAICFGLVPYFARSLTQAGMTAPAVAFYRYFLTAIVLLPFLSVGKGNRTASAWGVLSGAVMGLGWIAYVEALKSASVATVSVLYMTYPMFTVLIAWLCFGDHPGPRAFLAAGLIFTAAIIAMSPGTGGKIGGGSMAMALIAPLTFAFGINILTEKLIQIPPPARMAAVSLGSVIGLLPLILALGPAVLLPAATTDWWLIAGIAIVTGLVPQLVYVIHAPRIGPSKSAMAGSIELPTMFFVGWLTFAEAVAPAQWLAGAMVVAAIVITPPRRISNLVASPTAVRQ